MDSLEEYVDFLWNQCVCKEKDAYKDLAHLLGRGKLNDFVFDEDKIEKFMPMIALIGPSLVHGDSEARYYDLAYEQDGNQWAQSYFEVEKAVSLMNVAGFLEFCTSSMDWDAKESRNPKVRIKKNRK